MDYNVDFRDVKFQLFEWLPLNDMLSEGKFGDWDPETVEMALNEALKIAQEQLAPANEDGDREGAVWEKGKVTLPSSFAATYETVAEGGWIGLENNPEYGGLGLPGTIGSAVNEFFIGANMGLSLVFLLTRGASHLIEEFGTDDLRNLYCQRLYSGEWTGTMCLTEPHAGSDVGASTARAEPQGDGTYLLTGEKIFITFGDHDLTENVVHAVLARVPGAPAGTRGLSLFAVPKIRVNADGSLGEPNDVQCASIEHKLGIHGSPTCSILFGQGDACEGYLLGNENEGIRLMFRMMNAARIEVGLQGAAVAAASHQAAVIFAKERIQGRNLVTRDPQPVPIIEHPDVRRMLFTSSAYVQAMRALLLRTSCYIDQAKVSEGEERDRHQSMVDLLTPICKAWASDWGFRVTEWCLQVYGGYGYTRDYPAEQYLRDVKIASIYEGTNGIQALDLVGRKIPARDGAAIHNLMGMIGGTVQKLGDHERLGESAALLGDAAQVIQKTMQTLSKRSDGQLLTLLNAVPMLNMVGDAYAAHLLLEQADIAASRLGDLQAAKGVTSNEPEAVRAYLESDQEATFLHNKVLTAIHFAHRVLPQVRAHSVAICAGETTPMEANL